MSMSEVIEQMKRESVEIGATDRQKRYPGVCPQCGKELYICKSIAMVAGINHGHGSCPQCGLFLHIEFDSENQRMKLEAYEDARKRAFAEQKGAKPDDE